MARSPKILVSNRTDGQRGLFAAAPIAAGEVILTYDGPVIDHPTRLSIQIDDHRHIEGTDDSNAFVNHSCAPTAYVDWDNLCLRAIAPIDKGREITCNYLTTDDCLHTPFTCHCGASQCKGLIRGFHFLSPEEQLALEPWLPEFLKRKIRRA